MVYLFLHILAGAIMYGLIFITFRGLRGITGNMIGVEE